MLQKRHNGQLKKYHSVMPDWTDFVSNPLNKKKLQKNPTLNYLFKKLQLKIKTRANSPTNYVCYTDISWLISLKGSLSNSLL